MVAFSASILPQQMMIFTAVTQLSSLINFPGVCIPVRKISVPIRRRHAKSNNKNRSQTLEENTTSKEILEEVGILEQLPKNLALKELYPLLNADIEAQSMTAGQCCSKLQGRSNDFPSSETFVSAETTFKTFTGVKLECSKNMRFDSVYVPKKEFRRFLQSTVQHLFFQHIHRYSTGKDDGTILNSNELTKEDASILKRYGIYVSKPWKEKKNFNLNELKIYDLAKEHHLFGFHQIKAILTLMVIYAFLIFNFYYLMNLKKIKAYPTTVINETFDNVKGVDEAKEELQDIVEFLKNPEKFTSVGSRLPKGVLLVGPPGTGKTLLARAVAGEAGVPFFQASGSEFDGPLIGMGSQLVNKYFAEARKNAPCVIFVDEFDTLGRLRTSAPEYPYANQAVTQLLSEMDGCDHTKGIIVLAATNRAEDLDPAVTRPGRFDIKVSVDPSNLKGRKEILDLYLEKVVASKSIDTNEIAKGTPNFTGNRTTTGKKDNSGGV